MQEQSQIDRLEDWMARHECPIVRGVRHEGRWYVVLSNRRVERTGVGKTLEEAMRGALEGYCYDCAAHTCDR